MSKVEKYVTVAHEGFCTCGAIRGQYFDVYVTWVRILVCLFSLYDACVYNSAVSLNDQRELCYGMLCYHGNRSFTGFACGFSL